MLQGRIIRKKFIFLQLLQIQEKENRTITDTYAQASSGIAFGESTFISIFSPYVWLLLSVFAGSRGEK